MIETKQQSRGIKQMIQGVLGQIVRMLGGASMIKFLIRRLLAAIPVLLAILLVTFTLSHLLPGGPFNAVGQRRMPDYMVEQLKEQFGLNRSLIVNTWHDGYCPESEKYMDAAGCYDEYNDEMDDYHFAQDQYPAQTAGYQITQPWYQEAKAQYDADLAVYQENLKQFQEFTASQELNTAYNDYVAAQADYETAQAAYEPRATQTNPPVSYRELVAYGTAMDQAANALEATKENFGVTYSTFAATATREGLPGADANFETKLAGYESIRAEEESYLEARNAEIAAYQGEGQPYANFQAAADAYLPAKDAYESYMQAKVQYDAVKDEYLKLFEAFQATETEYNTALEAYNNAKTESDETIVPYREKMLESKNKVQAYESAKSTYESAERDLGKFDTYSIDLEKHEADLAQMETDLQPLLDAVNEAQTAVDQASEDELEAAQTQLAQAQVAYQAAAEPYNKAKSRYDKYQEALKAFEDAKAAYEAAGTTYEADLDQYKKDLAEFDAQVTQADEALKPYKAELDAKQAVMDNATAELAPYADYAAAWEEVKDYVADEAQLAEKETELADLKQQYLDAKAAWNEASKSLVEQPEEPVAPIAPAKPASPKEPVKPKAWSLLPTKRVETETLGGTQTSIQQVKKEVWRIDILNSQFFNYLWDAMHLEFGPSLNKALRDQNVRVSDEIARRLPVSMQVGVFAVLLGFLLGIPLGVLAAVYHNTAVDYESMFFAVIGQSTPSIVLAPILIIVFAVELGWVPVADQKATWQDGPQFSLYYLQILALPVITLGVGMSAGIARLTRASLLQVLHEDYVRTARAKGLRERVVIYVHALKNALIPVATILGPLLAGVLTGTFVVELIYVIPGLGKVFVESVAARDYTMIMGVSLLYSIFLILGNILVDIMYTWLDPRIRFD